MIKSVITETEAGFRTYSGWLVDETDSFLVLAAIADPTHEPVPVVIPMNTIVSDIDVPA